MGRSVIAPESVVAPGSVAVVTGCTRGFGRVLVTMLAQQGVKVVVSGIDGPEAEALAHHINTTGGVAIATDGDVTQPDDVAGLVKAAQELGDLRLWVNNAAYESPGMAAVDQMPAEVFVAIQQVNVLGTYRCTRAAIDAMSTGGGVVINITGRGDDLRAARFTAAYAASKAWIRSFSRSLAAEQGDGPVRVISFNPGIMATNRLDVQEELTDVGVDARTLKLFEVVTRVLADPPEVAARSLIEFLGSAPDQLKRELRLITPVRVARGLGIEAKRAGTELLDRRKSVAAR